MIRIILCMGIVFACGTVTAKIDYIDQYQVEYRKERSGKKSVGQIIKEVINRKEVQPQSDSTIPLPMYDSIDWDRLKNLA